MKNDKKITMNADEFKITRGFYESSARKTIFKYVKIIQMENRCCLEDAINDAVKFYNQVFEKIGEGLKNEQKERS